MRNDTGPSLPPGAFVTFWHGPLDPITYSCLASFPHHGLSLTLYSYAHDVKLPDGVRLADARDIIDDETLVNRYIFNGNPSLSKFSNYFRYILLKKTGACWVDGDVVCLRPMDVSGHDMVFGRQFDHQRPGEVNGAVLKLPADHPVLDELIARAASGVDISTRWGVLGPRLISEIVREQGMMDLAWPRKALYALPSSDFWKPVLPDYTEEVEAMTEQANCLHLWHESYRRSLYRKDLAPPAGSFLYEAFRRFGTLDTFSGVYDAEDLRHTLRAYLVERSLNRKVKTSVRIDI